MTKLPWSTTAEFFHPGTGRWVQTTLDKCAEMFGDLTLDQSMLAEARLQTPVDLDDGLAATSVLNCSGLARLTDLWIAEHRTPAS